MLQVAVRGKLLKRCFGAAKAVVDQGLLRFSSAGLAFGELDSAHVCFVAVRIERAACSRFSVPHDAEVGLALPALCKILNFANPDDLVQLAYAPGKDHLEVQIVSAQRKLDFELKVLHIEGDQRNMDMAYESWAVLPATEFRSTCRALADLRFSDTLRVELAPSALTFRLPDGMGRRTYGAGDDAALRALHCPTGAAGVSVALSRLQLFHCDADQEVRIEVDERLPLRLSTQDLGATVQLYIAQQEAQD